MNIKLLLIGCMILSFSIGCKTAPNSNTILLKADLMQASQNCTLWNSVEYASFKYTGIALFKTGKLSQPKLTFSADTIVFYKGKKHQVKLKYYDVRNTIFGVGSLATGNTTVLLFTKEKQLQYLEVKGVGSFEFRGLKKDKNYFKFALKDCSMYFSLNLNHAEVSLTEYTVESE